MAQPSTNLEVEIKLRLGSFTNYLKLVGFLGEIESEERQHNGFFDSEDHRLINDGWALRVRAEESRGLVTLKGVPKSQGSAVIREEIEAEIARAQAVEVLNLNQDVKTLAVAPVQHILEQYRDIELARLIQFHNTRQKKQFKVADYFYTFEIDKTEFHDGSVDYELEVELADTGRIEQVQDHLRRMFESLDIPFETENRSKLRRALERANIV